MKDIFSVDFRDSIRKVVRQELKEKFSIKTSKDKPSKLRELDTIKCSGIFGNALAHVPSRNIKDDVHFSIPLFLIESFQYLSKHLKVEGIFRKSGSVGRQKILREILEKEGSCCSCDFVQVHDIAALIKSFFRELPDPLLTCRLTPSFVKCVSLNNASDSISAATLCCLLLPDVHLRVLKYFTQFITEVANHSLESKMTLTNLAIIFAPNLTASVEKNSEKSMKDITQVVDLLFKNSHLIGMVPDALFNKAITLNNEGGFCSSSADELDENNCDIRGRTLYKSTKKRERSKSIKGFIRRNFKQNENSPAKHLRSNSQKVSSAGPIKAGSLKKRNSADDISVNSKSNLQSLTKPNGKSVKRRSSCKGGMSPVRKSPRLSKKAYEVIEISAPTFKSMSNQVAATPRRHLLPVQPEQTTKNERVRDNATVLPSKFDLSQVKSKEIRRPVPAVTNSSLARSKSSISGVTSHQHHEVRDAARLLPQPKLSRSTQKPHASAPATKNSRPYEFQKFYC
nr:rho GTPase-activating protein 11A isoform X2 [Hydra vulgaris]